jgi:hypothetical protein
LRFLGRLDKRPDRGLDRFRLRRGGWRRKNSYGH